MEIKSTVYKTKDLNEAAFLIARDKKFVGLQPVGNVRKAYWFLFDNKDGSCIEISAEFWDSKAKVNVRAFINALRTLKDRLFANRATGGGE